MLADIFEEFIKVFIKEFDINPLYCVSLRGFFWQCGLKYTNIRLQTLQDKDMILALENNLRGGISSDMGDGLVKTDENKKMLYKEITYIWLIRSYNKYSR